MQSTVIEVRTGSEETVRDLTAECERFLAGLAAGDGPLDGLLHVWVPHATAGLVVLETGAGSDADLLATLRELLPGEPCRSSTVIWPSAPGSRSAWSTSTATTRSAASA